jgi:HK97 family phage portal protein
VRLLPRSATSRRLDALEAEFRATSTLANPSPELLNAFGAGTTQAGERVTVDKAMGLSGVWSAVTLIAETLGMLPLKVYRSDENGDPIEATQHRAWRILHDRPNAITEASVFWTTTALHRLLWGNIFIETERGPDGLVNQLWLEPPDGMEVLVDRPAGRKVFRKPQALGGRKEWTSENMIHVMGPSTNGLLGLSPIAVCRQEFAAAMARDRFEQTFYGRGATMRGIVVHPNLIGETATKNLRESLNAIYGGAGNAHQFGVLEEGASFQSLSMPLSDLEFVASKQLSATQIAAIFKIPPAYLGGSTGDSLTYATTESNKTHFATFAVAPIANSIAKAVSQDAGIFPQQNSFYAEFVQEGFLRADTQARAAYYKEALDPAHGWMTRQEVRKRENLSERDDEQPEQSPAAANGQAPPELVANAQALSEAVNS